MEKLSQLRLAIDNILSMLQYAKFENINMEKLCRDYEDDLKKQKLQLPGGRFRRGAKTEKSSSTVFYLILWVNGTALRTHIINRNAVLVFPGSVAVHRQTLQKVEIAQITTRTKRHGGERIIRDVNRKPCFFADQLIKSP